MLSDFFFFFFIESISCNGTSDLLVVVKYVFVSAHTAEDESPRCVNIHSLATDQ